MSQTKEGACKSAAKNAGLTVEEYMSRIESGLKRCTKCKQWKPCAEYSKDRSRSDGLKTDCKECNHVKVRKCWKGRVSTFKGKHHTEQARQSLSRSHKGMQLRLGIPHTIETRQKISKILRVRSPRGPMNPNYKDGKNAERLGIRHSTEYKQWRFDVYIRDKFTCQQCGDNRGGNLVAHHIKPFADYPELRLDINNGMTLCESCHKQLHKEMGYGRNHHRLDSNAIG